MASKMAIIDFNKCHPSEFENGICLAVQACQRKLLAQEAPYQPPMPDPSLCRACGDCLRACPLGAIQISKF
ncbi:MAG: 4Fe-4S binding protein [Dehalococcoidales bacterium]|nr:MAG: 4Fe-4S binding protein [Dehalococcoidales bacterium]